MVTIKKKGWIWKLTFPFAHKNATTIGEVIYSNKIPLEADRVLHEMVHVRQQRRIGKVWFILRYLLCFPLFKNKFRAEMEMEAYIKGSKIPPEEAEKRVYGTSTYGWLRK